MGYLLQTKMKSMANLTPSCQRFKISETRRRRSSSLFERTAQGQHSSVKVSQSVSHYHTPSRELMAHTLTLLRTQLFFTNLHSTAYTAYDTYQQHLETARLAQGKLWATYESSEAVPHHLTVAWHDRRAARLLRQHDDCTAAPQSTY